MLRRITVRRIFFFLISCFFEGDIQSMIQDIAPHTFDNQYHAECRPQPDDTVLSFRGQDVYCKIEEKKLILPCVKELGTAKEALTYLFSIDGKPFFLMPEPGTDRLNEEPGSFLRPQ
jgi:hypothetical protein